jgi:hypothetical protein
MKTIRRCKVIIDDRLIDFCSRGILRGILRATFYAQYFTRNILRLMMFTFYSFVFHRSFLRSLGLLRVNLKSLENLDRSKINRLKITNL